METKSDRAVVSLAAFLAAATACGLVSGAIFRYCGDHPQADASQVSASSRRPKVVNPAGAGSALTYLGAATVARTWDFCFFGSDISSESALRAGAVNVPWAMRPDGGTIDAAFTDASMVAINQSSGSLSAVGLGSALVGTGVSFNGGWWQNSGGMNLPGYSGNGYRNLTRIIFRHEAGASGTAGVYLYQGRSGIGAYQIWAQSTTQFRVTLQASTALSAIVTPSQGISVGEHILDVFTTDSEDTGANNRLNAMFYFDGLPASAVEHTSDTTAWTGNLTNMVSIGAAVAGATPLLGRTVYAACSATGANQGWFTADAHYDDCAALGLCPAMSAGQSHGTNRGLVQGDGGSQNIVTPPTFIADGRTRTGWYVVFPATYTGATPVPLYMHFCGCTWTGVSCRGSVLGGSAATVDPNTETADPTGIHVYMDPQYPDITDCAGGNGWPKSNTSRGDYNAQYADAVLLYMRANYAISRTMCVGRSNGAAFCHYLGRTRPGMFSAIADTLGYYSPSLTSTLATGRVPVMATHYQDDPTVRHDFALQLVPFYLAQNLGIVDSGVSDGSVGWCVGLDSGGIDGSQIMTGCGCGGTQTVWDGGGVCCTWDPSVGNSSALDGGQPLAFRFCSGRTGGHNTAGGEGQRFYEFFLAYGEPAGG